MVSAESHAPSIAAVAGPVQVFMIPDDSAAASSGHLSDGSRSLSRRSRVRRKNSHRDEDSSSDVLSTSGDISTSQLFVKIPPADVRPDSSPKSLGSLQTGAPPRPPRSPRRLHTAPVYDKREVDTDRIRKPRQRTRSTDAATRRPVIDNIQHRGRETRSESGQHEWGQRSRGVSLPRHVLRNNSLSDSSEQPSPLTPHAFNGIPPMPVFAQNRRYRHQPRDSGVTQQSSASSSLYPNSTSTETSCPSPPSLPALYMDDCHILSVDPGNDSHLDALQEMDADEVSYRLRLLMQNNYYLPPAHSKPFSEIPSPDTPKKTPSKSSSPTFFDLFKVVKKKSSASADTKTTSTNPAPRLRTTSDSSTLSGLLRPQQSAPSAQHMRAAYSLPQSRQETKGRVVVVRERMDDLVSVAKQAEQELKVREAERNRNTSENSHSESIPSHFVDPTDSVDLPPVPANEFFGPQAALLRGMGIDSSLGAALLAVQLPPSSPGSWTTESDDVVWRKALLHAAVDHSLNSPSVQTPARSTTSSKQFHSSPLVTSTPPSMLSPSIASPTASLPPLPSMAKSDAGLSNDVDPPILREQPVIGQRIIDRIIAEGEENVTAPPRVSGRSGGQETERGTGFTDSRQETDGLFVVAEPVRASSPTVPTMPLQPPPRRPHVTPANSSGSRSDNAQDKKDQAEDSPLEVDAGRLQVEEGAVLRLSDVYESHVGLGMASGEFTPPGSQHNSATLSAVKPHPEDSFRISESLSTTSGSHYSDDDLSTFHTPQERTLTSAYANSRLSLRSVSISRDSGESSQPSPTTSAFRDAIDRSQYSGSSAAHSEVNILGDSSRGPSGGSKQDDAQYAVVPRPPRISSIFAQSVPYPQRSRNAPSPLRPSADIARDRNGSIEQEPETPTALHVPRLTVLSPATRAGSYPASPISFFDAVEMQSRQDEEDESSESDNDDGGENVDEDARDDVSMISSSVGGYQSDPVGAGVVEPRAGSTLSLVHDPRLSLGAVMQQRNASSPQLGSRLTSSDQNTGLEPSALDRRKAIENVPLRTSFWHKKHGKRHEAFPNPPRVSDSTVDWVKHEEAKEASAGGMRPQTAGSRLAGKDNLSEQEQLIGQDSSARRLDGLLIEHMEREKEVLKRITTTLSKSST